jgi:hypothetical protein
MPRVLALYYVIYIVFSSNIQQLKNKRHSLLFIEKYKKKTPYKLGKYQFALWIIFI